LIRLRLRRHANDHRTGRAAPFPPPGRLFNLNCALQFAGVHVTASHSLFTARAAFGGDAAFAEAYRKVAAVVSGSSISDGLCAAWGRAPDFKTFLEQLKQVKGEVSGSSINGGLCAAWGRAPDFNQRV
jgi:hypothetical protein